jgi:hypothetical protein
MQSPDMDDWSNEYDCEMWTHMHPPVDGEES